MNAIEKNTQTTLPENQSIHTGDVEPLRKYFIDALKDTLWAEEKTIDSLKKLQKSVTSTELKNAFKQHEEQTIMHIIRLFKVFELIGKKPVSKKCKAMEGILKEADEIISETPEGSATRDAAVIIAAQKIEHYEISSYGGLVAIAHTLGLRKAARMLQRTLHEEEETDLDLTELAESYISFDLVEQVQAGVSKYT